MPSWHSYRPPAPSSPPMALSLGRSQRLAGDPRASSLDSSLRFCSISQKRFCVLDFAEFAISILQNFDSGEF
jgi:hypothetical protein